MTDKVRTAQAIVRGYKISRMHASGMTHGEIGKDLGICRQRVVQLLQRHRERVSRSAAPAHLEQGEAA